jgi:hypothetical protein
MELLQVKPNRKTRQGNDNSLPISKTLEPSSGQESNVTSESIGTDQSVVTNKATPHEVVSSSSAFIEANTVEVSFEEIKDKHIIPVFIKDNEPVISHTEFIEAMVYEVKQVYHSETILKPSIRLSHPIKGRIPEAKNKAASELLEHERTIYYERMAFIIEIPSVYDEIEGSKLSLCVGGVKAYNIDNLYNKKGADEHFKIFIGFKNSVCTNLCIWTDGLQSNLKVQSSNQLRACILTLIENFNPVYQLRQSATLVHYSLTEQQFAHVIGKCRMYQCLSNEQRRNLPLFPLGDAQLSAVCKGYYNDPHFSRIENGNINLWRLHNLLTGANKSSYIDNFLDKSASANQFIETIKIAFQNKSENWFLN